MLFPVYYRDMIGMLKWHTKKGNGIYACMQCTWIKTNVVIAVAYEWSYIVRATRKNLWNSVTGKYANTVTFFLKVFACSSFPIFSFYMKRRKFLKLPVNFTSSMFEYMYRCENFQTITV